MPRVRGLDLSVVIASLKTNPMAGFVDIRNHMIAWINRMELANVQSNHIAQVVRTCMSTASSRTIFRTVAVLELVVAVSPAALLSLSLIWPWIYS
jgi:hypothetical protein